MSDASIVVTDPRLPVDKFILDAVEERELGRLEEAPRFTVSEIAKVFFGKSPHWVRWREKKGFFILDGSPDCTHSEGYQGIDEDTDLEITKFRTLIIDGKCANCGGIDVTGHRTEVGARSYTLADVEKMAHALAQQGGINGAELGHALLAVQTVARVWGYL